MSHAKQSLEKSHLEFLPVFAWDEIKEAGAYVERDSGNLYRIPKEVIKAATPIVIKECHDSSRMVQISKNPFVTSEQARLSCARHNIAPNF